MYAYRTRQQPAHRRYSALRPVRPGHSEVERPAEEWLLVATIPAIVSQEQFDQVQVKLARNQSLARRNNHTYSYLLRALVSCGTCHLACTGRSIPPDYAYYSCGGKRGRFSSGREDCCPSRYLPARPLDDLVWHDLCGLLTQPDLLTQALYRAQAGDWLPQELTARWETLRKTHRKLEQQLDRLTQAYLEDILPLAEYQRRRQALEQHMHTLDQQLHHLQRQVDQQTDLLALAAGMEDFCRRVRSGLDGATFDEKRQLVELLIDRVIVTEDVVEIHYVFPTSPAGERTRFCHLRLDHFTGVTR